MSRFPSSAERQAERFPSSQSSEEKIHNSLPDDFSPELIPKQEDFPDFDLENEDGWGPNKPYSQLQYLPLTSNFSKQEPIMIADWYNKRMVQRKQHLSSGATLGALGEVSGNFNLVTGDHGSNKPKLRGRKAFQVRNAQRSQQRDTLRMRKDSNKVHTGARTYGGNAQPKKNKYQKRRRQEYRARQKGKQENLFKFEGSIQIRPMWQPLIDFWLPDLKELKVKLGEWSKGKTLTKCGSANLLKSNSIFDKIRALRSVRLTHKPKIKKTIVTASEDPILQRFTDQGDVFITSDVMATLMMSTKGRLSFDVIVKKQEGKLWFDLRQNSNLHHPFVDECVANKIVTSTEQEKALKALSKEANLVTKSFQKWSLQSNKRRKNGEPCPFPKKTLEGAISTAYNYRTWTIPEDSSKEGREYTIVCRCGFDAFDQKKKPALIACTTQHNLRLSYNAQSWVKELDKSYSTIKIQDVQNNAFKYSRWLCEAALADCESILLGWVSREYESTAAEHSVLRTNTFKLQEFAKGFCHVKSMETSWACVDFIFSELLKEEVEDGKYVLYRDPVKKKLTLYSIDDKEFEEDEEES